MTEEFKREDRYYVIKLKTCSKVEAVVIEKDWPEYELVWQMIEARMTGQNMVLLLPPIADRFRELEAELANAKDLAELWECHAKAAAAEGGTALGEVGRLRDGLKLIECEPICAEFIARNVLEGKAPYADTFTPRDSD